MLPCRVGAPLFRYTILTSHEQCSHCFLPLNEDLDGKASCSLENGLLAINTLECNIACWVIVGVHTGVYVSFANVVQKILLSNWCEPVKMSDLDDTTKPNVIIINPSPRVR